MHRLKPCTKKNYTFKDLELTGQNVTESLCMIVGFEKLLNHLPSLWSSNQNQLALLLEKYSGNFLLQQTSIPQKWCIFNTNSNKQCILCAFQLYMRKVSLSVPSYHNYLFLISILAMTLHSVM